MAAMDLFKHIIALLAILNYITQDMYLLFIETIFNADWLTRSVFITAVIFSVPQYMSDVNASLRNTILESTL
jgi:hypothetical protein